MPDILVHQLEISPFCDKVRRVLHYKGLPFEVHNVPMGELGKLKKLSSIGKVPVVEIDGEVLADSSDICRELDKRFPQQPIFPEDPIQVAQVNILEDWADESLYFFEMTMRFTWKHDRSRWVSEILKYDSAIAQKLFRPVVPYLTKKQGQNQGLAKRSENQIINELNRHIGSLDTLLKDSDYLVGSQLTLADIAVLSQIECIAGSSRGLPLLEKASNVSAWISRVESLTGGAAIR